MSKKTGFIRIIYILSWIVIFIVFNLIAFLMAKSYDMHFWCGYGIVSFAWLCMLVVGLIGKENKKDKYLLSAPVILISLVHFFLQLILGIIVIVSGSVSVKLIICIAAVLAAIYIISVFGLAVYNNRMRDEE